MPHIENEAIVNGGVQTIMNILFEIRKEMFIIKRLTLCLVFALSTINARPG